MADTHEASVAQSLVAKIVSSYVRKNRIAPVDISGADQYSASIANGADDIG